MAKVVDVDQPLSLLKTSGRTGQKSLRNQNRRKKRMLTAEIPNLNMEPKKDSPTDTNGRDAL